MERFEQIFELAKELITEYAINKDSQALVLLSKNNNIYSSVINDVLSKKSKDEEELLEQIKNNKDTVITKIVCMWQGCCIDLPSHRFREALCRLDDQNKEAQMLLQGENGYAIKKIEETIVIKEQKENRCLRCSGLMRAAGKEKIQLGKYGLFFGHCNNVLSGALEVKIYICTNCGKVEFYTDQQDECDQLPQTTCPNCKAVHDFDYPKCPSCKYDYFDRKNRH